MGEDGGSKEEAALLQQDGSGDGQDDRREKLEGLDSKEEVAFSEQEGSSETVPRVGIGAVREKSGLLLQEVAAPEGGVRNELKRGQVSALANTRASEDPGLEAHSDVVISSLGEASR
jgi:hypothetical protein